MPELSHRLAVAALLVAGLLTAVPVLLPDSVSFPLMQHRQFMQAMLAMGVCLSAFVPLLRLAAIAGALLSNGALVALGLAAGPLPQSLMLQVGIAAAALLPLLWAGVVLGREAWQQARWDGVIPLRQQV